MSELLINTIPANIELILKIIILFIMLSFFIFLNWNSKNIDKDKNNYNYIYFIISNYMSKVYIFSSPFSFLLLYHTISFELFVWYLASIYLVFGTPTLIMLGLYAKDKILSYISKENQMQRTERKKYGNQ